MCGIVAYLGKKNGTQFILQGLKHLEYRGYDSVGVSWLDNNEIKISKSLGSVGSFIKNEQKNFTDLNINIGIGHTRWATHGKPSTINAHPHISSSKNLACIHNGIIENYEEMNTELKKKGINNISETDTEIFINYLDLKLKNCSLTDYNNLIEIFKFIKGNFALAILDKNKPKNIFLLKRKSPMIIGKTIDGDFCIASDLNAFSGTSVKKIINVPDDTYLNLNLNGEIVCLDYVNNKFLNLEFKDVVIHKHAMELADYKHYMLKEIEEQPMLIQNTINKFYDFDKKTIKDIHFKQETLSKLQDSTKIIFVGCGTSFHAAKLGEYLFENIKNIDVFSETGGEIKYRNIQVNKQHVYVFLSQSGETADLIDPINNIKQQGGYVIVICNVFHSTLSLLANDVLYMNAGVEVSVASTKAFTMQVILLNILSQKTLELKNQSIDEFYNIALELQNINEQTKFILKQKEFINNISNQYIITKDVAIFIGRNVNYPIALEGALKMKEISYINSDGIQIGELKHGALALIDSTSITIACETNEDLYKKYISNLREVLARNGQIISITPDTFIPISENNIIHITYPKKQNFINLISNIMILQLLAYYTALSLNREIDKPRNLAKSVTVE